MTNIKKENFDYDWISNNTFHHNYLIKSVKNILKDLNTSDTELLDVGCGNGVLTSEVSKSFKKTTGIDLSGTGIDFAHKLSNEKLNFENISLDEMIERNKKFKFITSFEVIEHQYLPDDFLNKINQLLADDGTFLVTTPYNGYIKNLIISILGKHDFHFNPLWRHGHIKFFSVNTLSTILKECNFEVIDKKFSGRVYPVSCSMMFLTKKIK
jgi:2-polyprenyl-6-hydroxyphenyl methylase/3-demethylubiquinone-9 3-methyltransferase